MALAALLLGFGCRLRVSLRHLRKNLTLVPIGACSRVRGASQSVCRRSHEIRFENRYAELRLGETIVELSEAHGQWGPTRGGFHLFVSDCDAVYAEALRAGATSLYEPVDKPYGERSAGVQDAWGNQWYLATVL